MGVQIYTTLIVLFGALSYTEPTVSFAHPSILWSESFGRWTKLKGFIGWNDQPSIQSHTTSFKYAYTRPINKASNWSIAYNQHKNSVYWLDQLEPSKLYKQTANNSFTWSHEEKPFEIDLTNQNLRINNFVVDWTTNNFYVTDPWKKTIVVIGKGYKSRKIVSLIGMPDNLCILTMKGLLFWSERISDNKNVIIRSNTLGDAMKNLLTRTSRISGMCLWKNSQNKLMLLWIESFSDSIMSCDTDGGSVTQIYNYDVNQATYKSAAVFENHIFLTNEKSLTIDVISISKRSLIQSFELDALPHDIITDVMKHQSDDGHECDWLKCEQLCVNMGDGKGKCLCEEGFYLSLDGLSCEASDSLLIYSTLSGINSASPSTQLPVYQTGNLNISVLPLKRVSAKYTTLAYHFANRKVFYSKNSRGSIFSFDVGNFASSRRANEQIEANNLNEGSVLEVTAQIGDITGLTVHWQSDMVMWMDGEGGYIMMSKMHGMHHTIVRLNLKHPVGLAVDSHNGLVFWSELSKGSRRICYGLIQVTDQDECLGEVQEDDLKDLVYDPRLKRLYWSNGRSRRISSYHMITRTLSHYPITNHNVHGFTVYQDFLILAQTGNQPLLFVKPSTDKKTNPTENNINSNNYKVKNLKNIVFSAVRGHSTMQWDEVNDVVPYNTYLQPSLPMGRCSKTDACEHICLSNPPIQSPCMCAMGFRRDGSRCLTEILTEPSLYFMDVFHRQIYQLSLSKTEIFQPFTQPSSPLTTTMPLPSSSLSSSSSSSSLALKNLHSYPHSPYHSPIQFVTHPNNNVLYVLDGQTIKSYNPQNQHTYLLYPKNQNTEDQLDITRISLDVASNKLFMTSLTSGKIYRVDAGENDDYEVEVWISGLNNPYVIHASKTSSFLYWSEQGLLKISRSLSTPTNISSIPISTKITSIFEYSCEEDTKNEKVEDGEENKESIYKTYCGYVYVSDNTRIYRVNVSHYAYDENLSYMKSATERKKRSNNGEEGVKIIYDVSKSASMVKDAKINSITIHEGFLYFSASNKKTVFRISLKDPSNRVESFPLPVFARITDIKVVYNNLKQQSNSKTAIIIGSVVGLLLLLLLLLLICCFLFFLCRKKKQRREEEKSILAPSSITTSATTLPSNNGRYGYQGEGDLLDGISGDVMYEHLFMTNEEVEAAKKNKNKEVSELTLNVETLQHINGLFHNTNKNLNSFKNNAKDLEFSSSDVIVDRSRGTLRVKKSPNVFKPPPSSIIDAFSTSLRAMNKSADSRPLPSVPSGIQLSAPVPPPPIPPSYLKESIKREINPGFTPGPPKLHTQARGFAPASHARPQAVKSTWGRKKFINN